MKQRVKRLARCGMVGFVVFLCLGFLPGCWGPRGDNKQSRELLDQAIGWYTGTAGYLDQEKAKSLFERAAADGGPIATMWIARLHFNSDRFLGTSGFEEDREKANEMASQVIDNIRFLAEKGDPEAQFLLGEALLEGMGVDGDLEAAKRWLLMAAEAGHPVAQVRAGKSFRSGGKFGEDFDQAVKWFRMAAGQDAVWGQFYLGLAYYLGEGVLEDNKAAFEWHRLAADRGLVDALTFVAIDYWEGQGVKQDMDEAYRLMKRAANLGDANAQKYLADMYSSGDGAEMDPAEAIKWYRLAAQHESVDAQRILGLKYRTGDGVNKDPHEAIEWFRKAAEQDDAQSLLNLGQMHLLGEGVPSDATEAAKYIKSAADLGLANAQSLLAVLYAGGIGLPKDIELAYAYGSVAVAGGIEETQTVLGIVRPDMSREQILRAQAAATEIQLRVDSPQKAAAEYGRAEVAGETTVAPDLTGSGFLVDGGGSLLTNAHVINGCRVLRAVIDNHTFDCEVQAVDAINDLALLRLDPEAKEQVRFQNPGRVRLGDDVVVVGFPLQGLLSSSPHLTTGVVSSLAGPGDDSRLLQISAAIQPGSSGGPVLDRNGNLIGVAVGKLDQILMAEKIGSIPENVGFAIRSEVVRAFLSGQGIMVAEAGRGSSKETAEIGEDARSYTARVECWK